MAISILKTENNRIAKFNIHTNLVDAQAHCAKYLDKYPTAFAYDGEFSEDLFIDANNVVSIVPRPVAIPVSVTMRQARLALLNAGLLSNVTTAINALPSPEKEAAQIEWEYSQEVHRDKPFVAVLATALGLTDAQLDNLFLTASTL